MSTISASTTSTTAYNVTADTTGTLVFQTGSTPTTALTINASQNLGLGVTPSAWAGLSTYRSIEIGTSAGTGVLGGQNDFQAFANAYYATGWKYAGTGLASSYKQGSGAHSWYTAASGTAGNAITFTQAMTLDASGNLLMGTTTVNPHSSGTYGSQISPSVGYLVGVNNSHAIIAARWNGNGEVIRLQRDNTDVGSIDVTTTATSYNTSSDYRLKEAIAPMTGALAKVTALRPVIYKWKVDGSDGEGFIAHELQAVVPQCVTGEKDAVDAEGNPIYQGIDTSFLVATLTAAIQEQQAIIEQLKADVAALKGAQA